jgi:hypothetical protein
MRAPYVINKFISQAILLIYKLSKEAVRGRISKLFLNTCSSLTGIAKKNKINRIVFIFLE